MKKQIILTLTRHQDKNFDTVLKTKTNRYRSLEQDFYDFISSASDFTNGGNTIISTKEYKESESKKIEAIKEIRKREEYHYQKTIFAKEHNMALDVIFHREMESELRRLGNQLEKILDTGDVNINTKIS